MLAHNSVANPVEDPEGVHLKSLLRPIYFLSMGGGGGGGGGAVALW